MVSRRRFVSDTVLVAIVPTVIACGGDDGDDNGGAGCGGVSETSSSDAGHTHSVCIPAADLMNPPTAGGTYITTNESAHTHAVALTAAQLTTLAGGGSVTVTTSVVQQHAHTFNLEE
jgi:hypothetical protein